MRARRGTSLIETVVMMSIAAVLMTITASVIYHLLNAERTGAESLVATTTVGRLANDFRRDAHAAATAQLVSNSSGTPTLNLKRSDGKLIQYTHSERRIVRTLSKPDATDQQKRAAIETYLWPNSTAQFELDHDGTLVTIILANHANTSAGQRAKVIMSHTVRVEAVVGRDLRFQETSP